MINQEIIEEVKRYLAEKYQAESDIDALLNPLSIEKEDSSFEIPEFLTPEAREFSVDAADEVIRNSGYNPANDFPIPPFCGFDGGVDYDEVECNSLYPEDDLKGRLQFVDENFRDMLLRKIDEKGVTDSYCYHKAGLQRQHFNKIKNEKDYRPKKSTVIALAFALELPDYEINEMLLKAGFALSPSSKFDLIIKYCIEKKIYDITKVNELLFSFDQELLGSKM